MQHYSKKESMDNKNITPEQSLMIIQSMIDNSRMKVAETGYHFISWGIAIILLSVLQYISIRTKWMLHYSWIIWLGVMLLSLMNSVIYEISFHKKYIVPQNKLNKIYEYVWRSFGFSLLLVIICFNFFRTGNITPIIMILVGMATFISGIIIEYKPLVLGGILFWIGTIVCLFLNATDALLVNAIAMLFGYVLPGMKMWKKYRGQHDV